MAESQEVVGTASDGRRSRVAVIGDFMKDVYWIGEATSLSAEVPIPVVKVKEKKEFLGGAGNVAKNLEALGVDAIYFPGGGIPVKNRLMVGDHQLARWDEFDYCTPVCGLNRMVGIDAIVVADYRKGSVDQYTIDVIKKHTNIPIFVDTKRDPSVWSGVATAIFPNDKEFNTFPSAYASFNGKVVLKHGSAGLEFWSLGNGVFNSPATARQVRSVNGAGDTVMAAFVYKWLELGGNHKLEDYPTQCNGCFEEMLNFANTAAAIAVEHPYTYAPTLAEVEARFYRNE